MRAVDCFCGAGGGSCGLKNAGFEVRLGIDWDEQAFEKEEKKHHVRRAFELMYRNLLEGGRAHTSTIEYCQQYLYQ